MEVNGTFYPMWGTFIKNKDQFIGGILGEYDNSYEHGYEETIITDITLEPNGKDSAFFTVVGKDFSCGFDVRYGGVSGSVKNNSKWITFNGYMGHTWKIKGKENTDGRK